MGNTPSSYADDSEDERSSTRWESVRKRLPRSVDFAPFSAAGSTDDEKKRTIGNFAAATLRAPLAVGGKVATTLGDQVSKVGKAVTHGMGNLKQQTTTMVQDTPRHLQNVFAMPLAINMATYKPPVYPKGPAEQSFLQGVLEDHFVFTDLSAGDILALVMAFDKYDASKGADLITQGELATGNKDYFYVLWSGSVDFVINGKVVGTASQPGEAFGELALLYSCPRAATVHCKTNVTVYRLDQKTFRFILQLKRQQAEDTKLALMSQVPLLANLQRRELHKLQEHLRPVTFTAGQVLSRVDQGEVELVNERLVIVQEGEIEVTNVSLAGAKYADKVLKAGDYAGHMGLLMDSPDRLADATALTDGLVWILEAPAFQAVLGPDYKTVLQERGQHATVVKQLSMVPLLDENKVLFDEFTLEALVELFQIQSYSAGETIVEERKRVEAALYFVTQGAVEVTSEKPSADAGYAKIGKGGFFGEDLLKVDADVMDRRRRMRRHQPQRQTYLDVTPTKASTYTVTCVADCTVRVLYLKDMRNVVDTTQIGKVPQVSAEDDAHKIPLKDLKRHKILGAGTFGQVWLVSYNSHDAGNPGRQAYALKVQSKYELCQSGQAKAVVHEKNIMAALHHPLLANLVDSYQDDKCVYMLMGLVQGGELQSVIHDYKKHRHGLAEADAKFFAAGIQEGLAFLHRRGYVYRDLKPENVLVSDRGYPVIVDYGFMKYITSKTYTFCGTPLYLPPEIILNQGHDWGADHWSFGVMLYEMIVGYTPFYEEGMDQMTLFKAIVNQPVTYPQDCSAQCRDLLKRLLRRRPSHRIGSGGEDEIFQHAWFSQIDFRKLFKQEYKSPYVPSIKDPLDVSNFDDWSRLDDKTKIHYPKLSPKEEEYFEGF